MSEAGRPRITFLGGTGTVTGSKYLVEHAGKRVLVDCGLFQGYKQLRLRNWAPFPIDPASIDAVVLTHAHIDHSGYVPRLVKSGYRGRVFCSPGTHAICKLLLPDSGHLQEQDADYANRKGFSRHDPALPLYSEEDAVRALGHLEPLPMGEERELTSGVSVTLRRAGHIVGASTVLLRLAERRLLFSGDLGRPQDPLIRPPAPPAPTDFLVVESTYGNREHPTGDPRDTLASVIRRTVDRRGVVLVPSFAVGRTQLLLLLINELKADGRIPEVPVFVDSPMATSATEIYDRFADEHCVEPKACARAFDAARYTRSVDDSKALDRRDEPKIIISASGMITGGRILHHLKYFLPGRRNTILIAGFQAGGTRGAALLGGAQDLKIHGQRIPVRAEVANLQGLSAHADAEEILEWLSGLAEAPRMTFVTHGEPDASDALRGKIEERLGWACSVPEHRDVIELD